MVDDSTTDDTTPVTNRGVNVNVHTAIGFRENYLESSSISTSTNPPSRSLTDIKNEIQTVLDLMGPSTPNLSSQTPAIASNQNTSSDADNEDSVLSQQSLESTVSKNKSYKSQSSGRQSSQKTSTTYNNESILADAGTNSSLTRNLGNVESGESYPCCDCVEPCIYRNPNCVCSFNTMNQNSVPLQVAVPKTAECFTNARSIRNCTSGTTNICKKKGLLEWLKTRPFDLSLKKSCSTPCDLYKINISCHDDDGLPKRVVFDLVEGIPKPCSSTVATNTIKCPVEKFKTNSSLKCDEQESKLNCDCSKNEKNIKNEKITARTKIFNRAQKFVTCDSEGNTRVDYYYFDHGNAQYFNTTDTAPVMVCEIIAEKTEKYTTRFWAEFFASIHIAFSFCVSFILQLFKFILYSIARPLTVGLMQLSSDYFFKPFLTTLFNSVIQPCLIFLYNIATSFRDLCDPIAEGIGYFLRELAILFRAIRLCTYQKTNNDDYECSKNNL